MPDKCRTTRGKKPVENENKSTWNSGGLAEWFEDDVAYLSVVFTWRLQDAFMRAVSLRQEGFRVRIGGPAVYAMPAFWEEALTKGIVEIGGEVNALPHHHTDACFTSRGCIRRCGFCLVPKIEGSLRELADDQWEPKRLVCDNNLLACSRAHFDKVIDRLKTISGPIDFNQGLDARLLNTHHADRLAELDCLVRLAWDSTANGNAFMQAYERLRKARIPKNRIQVYILIGFDDDPEDAWFRLRTVWNLGSKPNPMRYNPLDTMTRDSYVGPHWTDWQLRAYMRYWDRLMFTAGVPFGEWLDRAYVQELEHPLWKQI